MSKNSVIRNRPSRNDVVSDEEEGEEEEEEFYESLDRIASSSCSCSTSNSDSEPDPNSSTRSGSPSIAAAAASSSSMANYDIWISEPGSVSERRRRLLLQMGLSSDPSFSRRSVSYLDRQDPDRVSYGGITIGRSKSDGADRDPGDGDGKRKSSGSDLCSVSSNRNLSEERDLVDIRNPGNRSGGDKIGNGSSQKGLGVGSNKPPTGKNGVKRLDAGRSDLMSSNGNLSNGEILDESECNGNDSVDARVCTIKNLDNGKEFVVNEIREDGTWNKLKEVGTGRQLTLEEFEMTVGHSPIVQELMRRQNVEDGGSSDVHESNGNGGIGGGVSKLKKKGGWFKSIKSVASSMTGHKERRNSDERDTGSEKGGRRSSSATDDSQDVSFHGPERVKVRQYGKSFKELSALYKSQEIRAHNGSIWSIKFSLDGRHLASAGEDCDIHIWQVVESERRGELLMDKHEDGSFNLLMTNGSPEPSLLSPKAESHHERRRRGRPSISRKSLSLDHIIMPETVFALNDKPICSFQGHLADVLDLSWSKSQRLLSSSMDKTVRLWDLPSKTCLKVFSHRDYVTCIQFNPVDDRYFISGSLDAKVRIWSIPDQQVVDWTDLHEMVTAACYTPDGQGALVGSYKGSCRLYNASDNKLQQKCQISLQSKKKKAHLKKITGFQFAPGSSSEVLVTSADSRIRVVDGTDLVHKFKGFRNTNSQIAASLTSNGKYVVSASEDSYVYVWKHEADSRPSRSKGVTVARSYEHFHCQDVSVAIPWPGLADTWGRQDSYSGGESDGVDNQLDEASVANHPPTPVEDMSGNEGSKLLSGCTNSPINGFVCSATNGYLFDRISATWPEEKLIPPSRTRSPIASMDFSNHNMSAYGMVIITAGLRGEIRTYQNFGLPVRI